VRKLIAALFLMLPAAAHALPGCYGGGNPLNLFIPNYNASGDQWSACLVADLVILNGVTNLSGSTITANGLLYAVNSSTMATLAPMNNGGLPIGVTGASASTGTITGTANEINVTNGPGSITLATGGQTTTCSGANSALGGATYNGGVATGGACVTFVASGGNSNPQPSWQGFDYVLSTASSTITDSTATFSFNVEVTTIVWQGSLVRLPKQNFTMVASSYSVVGYNGSSLVQFGLLDLMPATISSVTIHAGEFLPIAFSSSNAQGVISLFKADPNLPGPSFMYTLGSANIASSVAETSPKPYGPYDCIIKNPSAFNFFDSCLTNAMDQRPVTLNAFGTQDMTANALYCWVVNNTSGGTATIKVFFGGNATATGYFCVDGGSAVSGGACGASAAAGGALTSISVPTGYNSIQIYSNSQASGTNAAEGWHMLPLPSGVSLARAGCI